MIDWEVIVASSAAVSAVAAAISAWSSSRSRRFAERMANDVRVRVELGTRFSDGVFFPFGLGTAGKRERSDGETGIVISVGNASSRSVRIDDFDLRLGKKFACCLGASESWQGGSTTNQVGVAVEAGSRERFYVSSSTIQGGSEVMDNIPCLKEVYACGVDRWQASPDQLFKMKYEYFRNISPSSVKAAYYRLRHWFARD